MFVYCGKGNRLIKVDYRNPTQTIRNKLFKFKKSSTGRRKPVDSD